MRFYESLNSIPPFETDDVSFDVSLSVAFKVTCLSILSYSNWAHSEVFVSVAVLLKFLSSGGRVGNTSAGKVSYVRRWQRGQQ